MGRRVKKPKYVYWRKDRKGGGYWYLERPGYDRVRLEGILWSTPFMDAYHAAMEGAPKTLVGAKKVIPRSIDDLAVKYLDSPAFKLKCGPTTQTKYRAVIDKIRVAHGHRSAKDLTRQKVIELHERFMDEPSKGNLWLKIMANMFKQAVKLGWRNDNPCHGVEKLPERARETQPWTLEQLAQYRDHGLLVQCSGLPSNFCFGRPGGFPMSASLVRST
jgi:hypothetical protein